MNLLTTWKSREGSSTYERIEPESVLLSHLSLTVPKVSQTDVTVENKESILASEKMPTALQ